MASKPCSVYIVTGNGNRRRACVEAGTEQDPLGAWWCSRHSPWSRRPIPHETYFDPSKAFRADAPAFSGVWRACFQEDWEDAHRRLGAIYADLSAGKASLQSDDPEVERVRNKQLEVLEKAIDTRTRPKPFVGLGASFGHGSDSYAHTVTWVSKSGHQVKMRWTSRPDDEPRTFTWRRKRQCYTNTGTYAMQPSVSFGTEQTRSIQDPHI